MQLTIEKTDTRKTAKTYAGTVFVPRVLDL